MLIPSGNMASKMDIIIANKGDFKGPLSINLHLDDSQIPVEVTRDGKTSYLSPHKPYKCKDYGRAIVITAIIIILAVLIGGIFAISNYIRNSSPSQGHEENKTYAGYENFRGGSYLRIVTKDEWLAKPESEALTLLKLPVQRVIIFHTAAEACTSQATCASRTLNIQSFHMDSRGFGDIGFNFLVGGDGAIYEGRGWDKQGAHTLGFNVDSIGIAFIGTYTKSVPSEGQLNAFKLLMAEGVRLEKLVEDYRIYGARQLVGTESPGSALFDIIKTWPHWSRKTY